MAYASLADVSSVYGIYSAIFPVMIYVIFGPSKHISFGTNPLTAILIGGVVIELVKNDREAECDNGLDNRYCEMEIVSGLALMCGLWQVALSVFRLGKLSWVLSEVLVSGYTTAAAVHVLVSQLKSVLGLNLDDSVLSDLEKEFKIYATLKMIFMQIQDVNFAAILIASIAVVALVINNEMIKPELGKVCSFPVPIQLIVVAVGTLFSAQFDFEHRFGIAVAGPLPKKFPTPQVPPTSILPKVRTRTYRLKNPSLICSARSNCLL